MKAITHFWWNRRRWITLCIEIAIWPKSVVCWIPNTTALPPLWVIPAAFKYLYNSLPFPLMILAGSPWRDKLSLAILELQEKGIIHMLYSKWWKNSSESCQRFDKSKGTKATLGVDSIGEVSIFASNCESLCTPPARGLSSLDLICSEIIIWTNNEWVLIFFFFFFV